MIKLSVCGGLLLLTLSTATALGQATTRPCPGAGTALDPPGPACLMAHQDLGPLPAEPIYWHLDVYASRDRAEKARGKSGTVVESFGKIWLFSLGPEDQRPEGGDHVADVGPLPLTAAGSFTAEYLRSSFAPGMTAPVHVHSGPEAFYALTGDTCLETPDGVQRGQGDGNSLIIRGGSPMLLMATGSDIRRGFALILHDSSHPATTLVDTWTPKGLCGPAHAVNKPTATGHYLFALAGDVTHKGNDFLAVIDADPASGSYGSLMATAVTDQVSMQVHADGEFRGPG